MKKNRRIKLKMPPIHKLDATDLASIGYWIGHFFTILATIIGVYYAAVVGLETALKVEVVRADRGTYYLSESLYKELEFNLEHLDHYIELFDQKKLNKELIDRVRFNQFVYDSAKYDESTFEIEPQLLAEISQYYFIISGLIDDSKNNGLNKFVMMLKIKEETNRFREKKVMERLAAYNKALAETIEARGVNLAQPAFSI